MYCCVAACFWARKQLSFLRLFCIDLNCPFFHSVALSISPCAKVFAAEGLRTLVLAYRKLSAKEASDWCAEWKRATEATSDRTGALEKAAAAIEKDLLVRVLR